MSHPIDTEMLCSLPITPQGTSDCLPPTQLPELWTSREKCQSAKDNMNTVNSLMSVTISVVSRCHLEINLKITQNYCTNGFSTDIKREKNHSQ